jgi:hypothetical protein
MEVRTVTDRYVWQIPQYSPLTEETILVFGEGDEGFWNSRFGEATVIVAWDKDDEN